MFDLKIINGTIVDGSGSKGYKGDVGIKGDKIAAIGDLKASESQNTIDAEGLVVSPGFIDMHTHSDLSILYDSHTNSKIYDGVTTEVVGNCGIGVAPVNPEKKQLLIDYLGTRLIGSLPVKIDFYWGTFKEYLDYVNSHAPTVNVAPLVAQGAVRIAEMGFAKEKGTAEQVKNMQAMVSQAMAEGALGLSSGLVYLPGAYTDTEELTELSKAVKQYGGFYVTHIRNEGEAVFEALEEAINIAKGAGVPLHVSHLKLSSRKVAGMTEQLFKRIEDAEKEGVEISFDVYPYECGMTALSALMPPWTFEGGVQNLLERLKDKGMREKIKEDCRNGIPGWQNFAKDAGSWSNITVSTVINESSKCFEGKTIEEIASEQGKEPYDAIFDMLIMENGRIQIVVKMMQDGDVAQIVAHKKAMYGSDGMSLSTEGILAFGKPHPRAFGTHGRVLGKYVREMGVVTLEEAVKKMTSMPAWRLKLDKRGLLNEGYYADITIFDPDKVQDRGTYKEPKQYTVGMDKVIVNGKVVLDRGNHQEVFPGKVVGKAKI
ncbi:MAG: N-acyl-D-amino-acid deacylase [Firmicutes bacterium]|nr:N-acyl-D-amino-acid deacylase [Bacillota bacterium]MDI6707080.1 D-aminoacylase [Bacillota bacterium]